MFASRADMFSGNLPSITGKTRARKHMRSKLNEAENSNESLYISVPIIVTWWPFFSQLSVNRIWVVPCAGRTLGTEGGVACVRRGLHVSDGFMKLIVHMGIVCIVVQEHDRHQDLFYAYAKSRVTSVQAIHSDWSLTFSDAEPTQSLLKLLLYV